MIYYLVTRAHTYTIRYTLASLWGKAIGRQLKIFTYENLFKARRIPFGNYIFADIERLNPAESERAAQVWQILAKNLPASALLNHPIQSMRRYELLRTLYEAGINQFNVYRLTDARSPQQFPVFIRGENDHLGPITELLHSQAELDAAISTLTQQGKSLVDKIITEFCKTADTAGITRKYSALVIGDQILPRHVFFNATNWMIKTPELTSPELVAEEAQYLAENPHNEQLRHIFSLAKIGFGRIDYGYINGKVQVWEINTNPVLLWPMQNDPKHAIRLANHTRFAESMIDAITQLNASITEEKGRSFTLPAPAWLNQMVLDFSVNHLPYRWVVFLRKQYARWKQRRSRKAP
jgi:hypothetical protein